MKARGRRPSAFIVSRCLELLMKPYAQIFIWLLKSIHTSLVISGYCFSALISHDIACLNNNQNVGNLLLFVVSYGGVKITESLAANTISRFHCPKTQEKVSHVSASLGAETKMETRRKVYCLGKHNGKEHSSNHRPSDLKANVQTTTPPRLCENTQTR